MKKQMDIKNDEVDANNFNDNLDDGNDYNRNYKTLYHQLQ